MAVSIPEREELQSLHLHQNIYEYAFKRFLHPLFIMDIQGNILVSNDAFVELFPTRLGRFREILAKGKLQEPLQPWMERIQASLRAKKACFDTFYLEEQGNYREILLQLLPLPEQQEVTMIMGVLKDVQALHSEQEADVLTDVRTQSQTPDRNEADYARYDYLTGLPNRRSFDSELQKWISENQEFSFLYIDIDDFKRLNDAFGLEVGDQALIKLAMRLKESLTDQGYVARMEGDTFTILVKERGLEVAKKILADIEEPILVEGNEMYTTASIGIASFPQDGRDSDSLFRHAGYALYRAKEIGKNNVQCYQASMNMESFKQYKLEKDLRTAILRHKLTLEYQPRVESETGKVVGVEALLRWQHPDYGYFPPNELIAFAEQRNLIGRLTEWIFTTVCYQMKSWENKGLSMVPVSINVSPKCFLKEEWLPKLISQAHKINIQPNMIEFEISGSQANYESETFHATIQLLKEEGFRVSLDQFGIGLFSFSQIRKLGVDAVKIDRTFIRDYQMDTDAAIIKSILSLSKGIKMNVVAMGVEDEGQLTFLQEHGCSEVQGYLFSKPLTPSELEQVLLHPVLLTDTMKQDRTGAERRQVFRFELHHPLSAEMTISEIKGKSMNLGKTEVLIEDLGIGGLCFFTHIRLPINPEIMIQFETELFGQYIRFLGQVVWKKEVYQDYFQYGVKFTLRESDYYTITPLINKLAIHMKKKTNLLKGRFIRENKLTYIKKMTKQEAK